MLGFLRVSGYCRYTTGAATVEASHGRTLHGSKAAFLPSESQWQAFVQHRRLDKVHIQTMLAPRIVERSQDESWRLTISARTCLSGSVLESFSPSVDQNTASRIKR